MIILHEVLMNYVKASGDVKLKHLGSLKSSRPLHELSCRFVRLPTEFV